MLVYESDGPPLTDEEHLAEAEVGETRFHRKIINGVFGRNDDEKYRNYIDPADPDLVYPSTTRVLSATHALQHILTPWAAKSAALFSVDNVDELRRRIAKEGPEEAVKWVAGESERIRDLKRDIGSHQHHILEALLLDTPIPACPEHLVDIEIDGEVVDQDAISDGLLNFLNDYGPTIEMAEAEVANTIHGTAGTLDMAGWFPSIRIPGAARKGARLVIDLKTGKVMGDTAPAQIVAYKNSTEVWIDKLGNKVDMPQVDMAAILHLRRKYKGGYKLYVVPPSDERFYFNQFLASLELFKHQEEGAAKAMTVFYPPEGDGSQPLPMVEDIKELSRWLKPFAGAGIDNLGELQAFIPEEIESIKGVGPKAVEACRAVLARYELAFAGEEEEA